MKKIALTVIIIVEILFLSLTEMQILENARANFIPTVNVDITSPKNGTTYETIPVLNVSINFYAWGNRSKYIVYSLDNSANITLTGTFYSVDEILGFSSSTVLPNLSGGKHSIKVYAWVDIENSAFTNYASSEVTFFLNKQKTYDPLIIPPTILVSFPQNNSEIGSNSINLVFNVSAPRAVDAVSSQLTNIYYKGDWQTENQEPHIQDSSSSNYYDFLDFNTTLSNIPEGVHKLEIIAFGIVNFNEAMFGYTYHSNTNSLIFFTVTPVTEKEPFPTVPVSASIAIAIVAIVSIGLLIYFRRHKSKMEQA